MADRIRNNQLLRLRFGNPPAFPRNNTMPQVISSTTAVRIAVARSEFTSFKPAFAKMAVNAAKTADSTAYISQYGTFDIIIYV